MPARMAEQRQPVSKRINITMESVADPLKRPGPCPRCDDDHIQATCLAPFGVYGGCKSARVVWDAGHAAGLKTGMAANDRQGITIRNLRAEYARMNRIIEQVTEITDVGSPRSVGQFRALIHEALDTEGAPL